MKPRNPNRHVARGAPATVVAVIFDVGQMKLLRIPVLLIAIFLLSCSRSDSSVIGQHNDQAIAVSLGRLLEHPEEYARKFVRVSGVLRVEFEGTCLYVNRSAYEKRDYTRSLWANVSLDLERLNGKQVILEAEFSPDSHGHLGLWRHGSLLSTSFISTPE